MAFRGRLWVKFNSYKHWAILLSVRPSQGSQREGHSSPNPKENEGKNKCYVSSARNTVPFLTLLNRASQEAEYFRKYILVAGNRRLDRSSCPAASGPTVFGSCDVLRWDPWECPVPCSVERIASASAHTRCTQHFPICLDLRTFPPLGCCMPWKTFSEATRIALSTDQMSPRWQANVTKCHHGDKQTLACFLYHSRCTACSDCLSSQESKHRERAAVFSSVEDQLATLAFLKPRVAELIEELIGVNNKGFNPDLEENTAQLDADFYP